MDADSARQLLFVGVDASNSRAIAAVPQWSSHLGRPLHVRPVDVAVGAGVDVYTRIADELADPQVAGAVITGHKVAMYAAAQARCVYIAPDAQQLLECNVLASGPHGLTAHATDVASIGAELARIWPLCAAPVVCLGAGGSGAALCLHLLRGRPTPRTIVMCERDLDRANEFVKLFSSLPPAGVELRVETGSDMWEDVVTALPPGALIVNATGLGKTRPASPLPATVSLPRNVTVWDLNYRGPLPFLGQAHAQAEERHLDVHDGWHLFSLGWLAALRTVLNVGPAAGDEDSFVTVAEEVGR